MIGGISLSDFWVNYYWENLNNANSKPKSDYNPIYNCIAFVANIEDTKWWPIREDGFDWPVGFPLEETVENFIYTFQGALGYELCESNSLEDGYEKLALYVKDNEPTHMAKQLVTGRWISKLGKFEDIEHDFAETLNGRAYGEARYFLKKKRSK